MAALGSDDVSMRGNADEASVELQIDSQTYRRGLMRQGTAISSSGNPYLEDPTLADLFDFLLESNETRHAVANSENPRGLIMRPVDTDAIQTQIDLLLRQRNEIEQELEECDSNAEQTWDEKADLEDRLAEFRSKRSELEDIRYELEYLEGFSEYLVVALLPEDASALSNEYQRISVI